MAGRPKPKPGACPTCSGHPHRHHDPDNRHCPRTGSRSGARSGHSGTEQGRPGMGQHRPPEPGCQRGTASGRRLGLNTDCARSNGGEGGAKILSGQARLLLRAHNRGLKAAKSLSQVQTRARPSPRDDFSRRTAKPATMRLCPLPNAVWGAKSLDVVVEPASLPGYLVPLA